MRAFADKLIEVLENHTEAISGQWGKAVSKNSRTPSFHSLNPDQYIPYAVRFYKNIRELYFSKKPHTEETGYFLNFAEEMYGAGVPLHEVIYALMLMRRQIWLFADFNVLFVTTLDMHQAVESINRTILMFDHVIQSVAKRYDELAAAKSRG
jgi:hypothetical protein